MLLELFVFVSVHPSKLRGLTSCNGSAATVPLQQHKKIPGSLVLHQDDRVELNRRDCTASQIVMHDLEKVLSTEAGEKGDAKIGIFCEEGERDVLRAIESYCIQVTLVSWNTIGMHSVSTLETSGPAHRQSGR